jgi:serine acetyltransferase
MRPLRTIKRFVKHRLLDLPRDVREVLLEQGASISPGAFLSGRCFVDGDYGFLLEMRDGAVVAAGTYIMLHDSSLPNVRGKGPLRVGKVVLEERAYVGACCVLLPGVRVGRGAIVAAGSVVHRDIPPGEVWGGAPVGRICTVDELASRRASQHRQGTMDIEYIGEVEKKDLDYAAYKQRVIEQVRSHFAAAPSSESA